MSQPAGDDYYNVRGCARKRLLGPVERPPWDGSGAPVALMAEDLLRDHYCVFDGFIDPAEAAALRDEVYAYYTEERMVDGEIGQGALAGDGTVRPAMRTDKVLWLEGTEGFVGPHMKRHIKRLDILTQKIAVLLEAIAPEEAWTGAGRSKIMATVYGGHGARYVPHYDNPHGNGRKLTGILYLNPGWEEEHGGMLRIKAKGTVADVAPLLNRLLLFWSDRRCPHEVLPATGPDRLAITIWFMDEVERSNAAQR